MSEYWNSIVPMMDTNDLFIKIGFAPDVVRLTNLNDGSRFIWNRCEHGHFQGAAASGGLGIDTTGAVALNTSAAGIVLCKFTDEPVDTTSDPAIVDGTNFHLANGIKIGSTAALLADDQLLLVEAWRANFLFLKAYHDGTTNNNTYFEDTSYDFKELGVSGNGRWIIYNQSNGNYAYIKKIEAGTNGRHSRIYTATDQEGTATTAADFDTNDVCYIFPLEAMPYPFSDIGIMT